MGHNLQQYCQNKQLITCAFLMLITLAPRTVLQTVKNKIERFDNSLKRVRNEKGSTEFSAVMSCVHIVLITYCYTFN